MAWEKSSPQLIERFDAALPDDPRVQRRQMFGFPCAFVQGQMFCGLFQQELHVRLGEAQRAKALALPGAKVFEPMAGRPMREYVSLPQAVIGKPAELKAWLGQGLEYVAAMPLKRKAAAKAAKKSPQRRK
jgi:TfoX/Sxy family transcriptional regulator of competence genes